jgi:hypothetical protein
MFELIDRRSDQVDSRRMRRKRALWRAIVLVFLLMGAAVAGVAAARGVVSDSGIQDQTVVNDPVGDSAGADLASLTITSYADQTVSFAVAFANRQRLAPGETVQIFVDLNDDGKADLNLSIWATGEPSYLDNWNGSAWVDVRQLPELSEYNGGFSVRLHFSDLTGAAQLPIAPAIGVAVGAWSTDLSNGQLRNNADDLLPDNNRWILHQVAAPPTTSTQSTTTQTFTPPPVPPKLAVSCAVGHTLRATVTPGSATIVSVSFYANGALKRKTVKAPFVALIKTKGLHTPVAVRAVVTEQSKTQTLTAKRGC